MCNLIKILIECLSLLAERGHVALVEWVHVDVSSN